MPKPHDYKPKFDRAKTKLKGTYSFIIDKKDEKKKAKRETKRDSPKQSTLTKSRKSPSYESKPTRTLKKTEPQEYVPPVRRKESATP